jgi:phosphocarrier protein HPr
VPERQVRVESKIGLHARPAAQFVRAAATAPCEITVAKRGCAPVNGKSMLGILRLDAQCGDIITISAEGENAELVLDDLATVVTTEV